MQAATGWPTASSIRFTWCLRPSWIVSSTRTLRGAGLRGSGAAVVERDALPRARRSVSFAAALDLGHVDLVHLVAGMREPVGELAVVCQQQRAGRVRVQAADGDDPRLGGDQVDDRRASLRVARSGYDPGRLVQQHVGEPLLPNPLAVDLDRVPLADHGVQLARRAVHSDPARLDQLVRAAAAMRRPRVPDTRSASCRHYSGMPHYISLMRWTSQGVAGLPGWRERVEEGERIIEEAGGELVGVYVTLGRYDVVEIFEAPDDDIAVEILLKLQRYGAEHTETLRAFTRDEAEAIIRKL